VALALGHLVALGGMCFALDHGEVAFDYYRMWGGDLKRRGDLEASALAYERANAVSDGPARLQQLGDVYARLNRPEDAHTAWLEARARNERLLATLLTAQNRAPNDAERRFDTGETQLRLAGACRSLSESLGRKGESEAAREADRCADQNQRDAAESFTTGLKFAPTAGRGHTGLRQSRPRGR
jgi:tetratricopeptide (TPR) repeat protein